MQPSDVGGVVRRSTQPRSISSELLGEWHRRQRDFDAFLSLHGVDENTHTQELVLAHVPITDDASFERTILASRSDVNEAWVRLTVRADDGRYGIAMPTGVSVMPQNVALALYVEVHSRLIAWWLTYAWRSQQLASATSNLSDANQTIASASCARSLLETAAAFWVDARKLAEVWIGAKTAGKPILTDQAVKVRQQFVQRLTELQLGGKFDDDLADAAVFGRHNRTNVAGPLKKLAKRYPGDLRNDYAWLCNTVHPSLGNTLAFAAPPLVHRSRTHMMRWLAASPIRLDGNANFDQATFVDRSIPSSTARAACAALDVLTTTLAAALAMIDDIGLTTGAPAMADFPYWRNLSPTARNESCACGSGKKTKNCIHSWGAPTPPMPEEFSPPE